MSLLSNLQLMSRYNQWMNQLENNLQYTDTKGNSYNKNFGQLIHNLFNHQTHHRGQATTLISQEGLDVGVTDWLAILPEQ